MGLGDLGEFLGHVGTLGIFKVMDNHDRSDNAKDDRSRLDDEGKRTWEGDRTIIGDEWSRLQDGSGVTMAKAAVTSPEPFISWPHQEIWDALNGKDGQPGVSAADVNAGADGWRRLTTGTETAVNDYRTKFEQVLSEKWSGASGNAAIDAIKSYTAEAAKLPLTFQMVANGIDHMEGLLGQAKIAIPKPEELSGFDEFVGHIPGNGVVKAASHRANEAEESARLFMIGTYQPGSLKVDGQTPVLPVPQNTVGDGTPDDGTGGGNNRNGTNGGTTGGTPSTTNPAGTPENPTTTTPQSNDTGGDQGDDGTGDSTTPSSTTPAATTPAATTPAGTGSPSTPGDLRTGGAGSPGTGGSGSGAPGSGTPGSGVPGAGSSLPGTQGGAGTAGSGARAAGAGGAGRGMSGMPGMMGGGGRGGNGRDDENEHAIPDYLIQDRESELIGQLPPTLPPGGVIG
ncbi:hypothetical protein ACFVVM_28875 [Nocardia sp. NPDC058176]|uniref:hypothetical protein n=1 Tax=Nocardia sp. NPDC058176 TaxID=3346368 RepID=UPI0036DF8566